MEYEGFATVVMDSERGSVETLFGNGNKIKTEQNGDCILEKCDGAELHFDIKGMFKGWVSGVSYRIF